MISGRISVSIGLILFLSALPQRAQTLQFERVTQPVVEDRLAQATRDQDERYLRLKALFTDTGCGPQLAEAKVKHSRQPNLVCTLPGTGGGEIIVGAHFDSVTSGTGALDNWSGAALLPTLYQSLAKQPHKHTFRFIGFASEEKGLVGSQAYVKALKPEDLAGIRAMINLDSVGAGPLNVGISESDQRLAGILRSAALSMKSDIRLVNTDGVGTSDHQPFRAARVPVMNLHSITTETLPLLHSRKDTVEAIDRENYYLTYRILAIYLVLLDQTLP